MIQSVEYIYIKFWKWRKKRKKLVRKLENGGITWQAQSKRRWLASLFKNNKVVRPPLRFLKATGIRKREKAREKELE